MKIRSVKANNRRKTFEFRTASRILDFPYAHADPAPESGNLVAHAYVDSELDREAVTYALKSGAEGTIHIEQVLEYNQDPGYLKDQILYELTITAQELVDASDLSKREIIRRLGTSASQFYRLLDQTNYRKSVDQMLFLLHALDCDVELVVKAKSA